MTRLDEIAARLAAIQTELESAEGEALAALEREVNELTEERTRLQNEAQTRAALRGRVAVGTEPVQQIAAPAQEPNQEEARAQAFAASGHMTVEADQARSLLISSGTLATPTAVHGINDIPGSKVSSIIDLIKIVNCAGMGSNKVAYVDTDAAAAATQTEGSAVTASDFGTYKFVTISPESVLALGYISKQVKKQTPLQYSAKVNAEAMLALRKKAAAIVTSKLKASTLNASVAATVASAKGAIDEKTLRKLTLAYGGDESVIGGAVLFLNKTDLVAFGDVRGTNEKKAIYEITPDAGNPNTGIIKDGGLSVRYCINSNLTACSGTAQGTTATPTMIYGNPQCLELDLFSDYEIKVSEDFAFDKLMDTIRGDAEIGADVTVKNGFVALTLPAKS